MKKENKEFLSFEEIRKFKVEVSLCGSSNSAGMKELLVRVSHGNALVYIVRNRRGKVSEDLQSTTVLRDAVQTYNSIHTSCK